MNIYSLICIDLCGDRNNMQNPNEKSSQHTPRASQWPLVAAAAVRPCPVLLLAQPSSEAYTSSSLRQPISEAYKSPSLRRTINKAYKSSSLRRSISKAYTSRPPCANPLAKTTSLTLCVNPLTKPTSLLALPFQSLIVAEFVQAPLEVGVLASRVRGARHGCQQHRQ